MTVTLFDVGELLGWDADSLEFELGSLSEANDLLAEHHYLGPLRSGGRFVFIGHTDRVVAAMIWRLPTARHLPNDGSWLELSRWCLTPAAGKNAGSKMHGYVVRWLRQNAAEVTTLVSYSDPSAGHTGALYKSCNWLWRPTWHRLRPPPSGNGSWSDGVIQSVKDRWAFPVRRDPRFDDVLRCTDASALAKFSANPQCHPGEDEA